VENTYLLGLGISDHGLINPVSGLGILGVVNLLGRVDGRFEVFEKATLLLTLAINENFESIIGAWDAKLATINCCIKRNTHFTMRV